MNISSKIILLLDGRKQKFIADKADIAPAVISKYISRYSTPRADIALKIARAFNVPLDWLVDDSQNWPPPQNTNHESQSSDTNPKGQGKQAFEQWAIVELMGHQRMVGKVTEATIGGGAFIRVDVPMVHGLDGYTRFVSPQAIYAINPCSEKRAQQMAEKYCMHPISRYKIPQLTGEENSANDH